MKHTGFKIVVSWGGGASEDVVHIGRPAPVVRCGLLSRPSPVCGKWVHKCLLHYLQ